MGPRRLFKRDFGEHPPEIQEFLESYHHYPRRGGEYRRISIGAPSSAEVRENARWFGRFLLLTAIVLPAAYWKWTDEQLTIVGWMVVLSFSLGFAAFGVVLLRSGRTEGNQTVRSDRDA